MKFRVNNSLDCKEWSKLSRDVHSLSQAPRSVQHILLPSQSLTMLFFSTSPLSNKWTVSFPSPSPIHTSVLPENKQLNKTLILTCKNRGVCLYLFLILYVIVDIDDHPLKSMSIWLWPHPRPWVAGCWGMWFVQGLKRIPFGSLVRLLLGKSRTDGRESITEYFQRVN